MALPLADKIKPKNGGTFALVDAADVELPDGGRLTDVLPVFVSEEEYAAMEKAGTIDPNVSYYIYK